MYARGAAQSVQRLIPGKSRPTTATSLLRKMWLISSMISGFLISLLMILFGLLDLFPENVLEVFLHYHLWITFSLGIIGEITLSPTTEVL